MTEFIEFMVRCGVLSFGEFVTKSGRKTPYFMNSGRYSTGAHLQALGGFYARALVDRLGDGFDVLFGPAYKGIPLATAASMVLQRDHGRDVGFSFNRKEAKDHGEGGSLVGHPLRDGDRVVIIEDVTTAGTSVRESIPMLKAAAAVEVVGLVVSVDRQERGQGERSALSELADEFSMTTFAIVTIDEIVDHLKSHPVDGKLLITPDIAERIAAYRAEYGAA